MNILQVVDDEEFRKIIFKAMIDVGKENKLNSLEQVKTICLTSEQFTIDNGLLTPTLKNKRPALRKKFAKEISDLYEKGPINIGDVEVKKTTTTTTTARPVANEPGSSNLPKQNEASGPSNKKEKPNEIVTEQPRSSWSPSDDQGGKPPLTTSSEEDNRI